MGGVCGYIILLIPISKITVLKDCRVFDMPDVYMLGRTLLTLCTTSDTNAALAGFKNMHS